MADLLDPLDKLARIAAIGPYQQQAGETRRQSPEDKLGSVAVLDRGAMHHHGKDQTDGLDNDMSFAAVDFLAGVVTVAPPFRWS